MAKLKNPLLSLGATGPLGKLVSYAKRRGQHIIEKKPIPTDARSPDQLFWRSMYQKGIDLWHALSSDEQQEWESSARPRHMTGFAWFMSQCLKPNPGLYLPLVGGTMKGIIDMDSFRVLNLPEPVAGEEPLRLMDKGGTQYQDIDMDSFRILNLPEPALDHEPLRKIDATAGPYTEGARVYHSEDQNIASGGIVALLFDSERYDTDTIHDPTTNNSRLTCRTSGKYLISALLNAPVAATKQLKASIYLNGTVIIGQSHHTAAAAGNRSCNVVCIYDLAVNNYVEVKVWQNSGDILYLTPKPNYSQEFMMQRIG